MKPKVVKKKSRSKLWFLVHSWLALPLWVFVFFVCLTGSIATISQEIVWLTNPAVRANAPSGDAQVLGYDAILERVTQEQPGAVVQFIARPVKSQYALTVRVTNPDATVESVYVNPYTGEIQGQSSGLGFQQFIRALHGWLLIPFTDGFSWGWYAVSFFGIPLLLSLITGLVVYKRFWRGFMTPRLRMRSGARVFWGDFHRLAGIWSIPFIILIAVSSIWFLTMAVLADNHIALGDDDPPVIVAREDVPTVVGGKRPTMVSLDRAAQIAHETFPDLQPSFVSLPPNAFGHIRVGGRGAYPLLFETMSINPYNGKVEESHRVSDHSALELFTDSMRPLHTGDFAGLWLKLVYFLFGLLLTFMVLSGLLIWTKRTVKATVAYVGRGAVDRPRRWPYFLSAILLLVPLAFLPNYLDDLALTRGVKGMDLGQGDASTLVAGPWSVRIAQWRTDAPLPEGLAGHVKTFALALCEGCETEIRAAYLRLGKPRNLRTAGSLFSGSPYRQMTEVVIPPSAPADADLWLTLEGWDGSVYSTPWPVAQASPTMMQWLKNTRS